ncbi:MAG: hypothetical protein U5L72_10245 [Bacteroidales bacterium]|nr:hypothetical protein [Bacteroidales bacterium]
MTSERLIVRALGAYKHPQVVNADALHVVKLPHQPLPVAIFSLAAEDGSVPVIGAYIIVRLAADLKNAVSRQSQNHFY